MTLFSLLATLLVILTVVLLALPLWRSGERAGEAALRREENIAIARRRLAELTQERRRSEIGPEEYEAEREELERRLAQELSGGEESGLHTGGGWLIGVLALAIPAATIALYSWLGSPRHLQQEEAVAMDGAAHEESSIDLNRMVDSLRQRLDREGGDADSWFMLGRSYMVLEEYREAARAFGNLRELVGDHPKALLAQADALSMAQGGRMAGEPAQLAQSALEQSPGDTTALWLVGKARFEQNDFEGALELWRRAHALLAEAPEQQRELESLIARAERRLAGGTAAPSLPLRVELTPAYQESVPGDAVVFIYVRAAEGPPMPLAARRVAVASLPLSLSLGEEDLLRPGTDLQAALPLQVQARVSLSGEVSARSGDLESASVRLTELPPSPVSLTIDRVVP